MGNKSELWIQMYQVAFNIFLFIVIQSIFFYFVSSSFVKNVIQDKIGRITDIFYKQLNPAQKQIMAKKLEKEIQVLTPKAEESKRENEIKNAHLMLTKPIAPSYIASLALILFIVPFIFSKDKLFNFSWEFFLPLLYMLLAYGTEVGVFFILMNRYEYIGTFEILNRINNNLPSIENTNIFNNNNLSSIDNNDINNLTY